MKKSPHRFGLGDKYHEDELGRRFMALAASEPKLYSLAIHIDDVMSRRKPDFAADSALWYGVTFGYKAQMSRLVGCGSTSADKELQTSAAYDLAYDFLYYYLIEERLHRKKTLSEIEAASPEFRREYMRTRLVPIDLSEVEGESA